MTSLQNHAMYQIAAKALIYKDDKILALFTPDGYLDFPGGRVDESERSIPWTEALKREITEEIGESVFIEIENTLFVSKRQYDKNGMTNHIAAIFFKCQFISGDIKISEEHSRLAWLTLAEILDDRNKFVSEDERNQLTVLYDSNP
jgi:8-oxo-dGTP pyrophosphatase MutT (NUDIX family)